MVNIHTYTVTWYITKMRDGYAFTIKSDIQDSYRVVPGDRNCHIETADWNLAGFFTIFRNLLAGIWGSFLRFIETGFRNWLAAFLGFFYDFSMMSMIFQDFFIIFL